MVPYVILGLFLYFIYTKNDVLPSWGVMEAVDLETIKRNKYPETTRTITDKLKSLFPLNRNVIAHELMRMKSFNDRFLDKLTYIPDKTHYDMFKLEDTGSYTYKFVINYLNNKYNLDLKENAILDELYEFNPVILEVKRNLNRLRPERASGILGIPINVYASTSANTPSMPAGHSVQGMLFAAIVYRKNKKLFETRDDELDNIMRIGFDIGLRRIMAGLHFLSDHVAAGIFVLEITKNWDIPVYETKLRRLLLSLVQLS